MKYLVIAFMLLLPYGLFAQPLSVGTTIEATQFKDQFEKNLTITAQTQQLIVVFSKVEGEKVKAFLEANPNYLRENNALYLMDVTPVPSMVMSMFMLPKFKKYTYPIGLIEDETILKTLPKKEKFITLITLDNLKITAIEFIEAL
jgi:hypothetical protein